MIKKLCILWACSTLLHAAQYPPIKDLEEQITTYDFGYFFDQGNNHFKEAHFDQAIESYKKALSINSTYHQAYLNLGLAYAHNNDVTNAIANYKHALTMNPSYVRAYVYLGDALLRQNKTGEAQECYKKALSLDSGYFDAMMGYAKTLCLQNDFDQSIRYFKSALLIRPNHINALLELANTCNMANQTEDALVTYYKILKQSPNNPNIMYNIAYTLKKLGRVQEAMPLYHEVIKMRPDYAEAHFGLGLSYLLTGDWEKGWQEYEWRWKRPDAGLINRINKPRWEGQDLSGKTILLHGEQGLGDTLQFIRYAELVKKQDCTVVVASQTPLVQLLSLCPYIDKVVSLKDRLPECDLYIPLVSLPLIFKTTPENTPVHIPYLFADQDLVKLWKENLADDHSVKIGICWQGNPNYSTHFLRVAVAAKSIDAQQFAPIANVPDVTLYSLQRESGTDQKRNFQLQTFGPEFDRDHGRFMDTAALIKNLDLVITVDTSIAHLAGGLGVPVWLLLPNPPDWRWMLGTDETPWYPNMRLFRQPKPGDWDSVIKRICTELHDHLHEFGTETKQAFLDDLIAQLQQLTTDEQSKVQSLVSRMIASH